MYMSNSECPACKGARLRPEILSIKIGDKNINDLTDMSINKIKDFLNNLELTKTQAMIADMILKKVEVKKTFTVFHLNFLQKRF